MQNYLFTVLITPFFLFSCAKDEDNEPFIPSDDTFSSEQLTNAANYSLEKGGSAVLILENDNIIFEDYHNGANQNTASHIYSATKFFWASATALAKQQGLLEYDELVSNTLTEWQNGSLHPNKDQIKIKHLLTLSSGLSQDFLMLSNTNNTYQYALNELDMVNTPGSQFSYGPSNYYVYGVLLERKLNNNGISQNPLEYLESEIFNKIGLEYESWSHDQSGNPNIPNGCTLTPRNWIKYGQLLLNKGKWNDEQIIETALIEEMFVATGPNPGHGNFAWLNNISGYGTNPSQASPPGSLGGFIYHNGYSEIIAGLGAGKNRMYLIPSLNISIIRQTMLEDDTFEDSEFLELLLD